MRWTTSERGSKEDESHVVNTPSYRREVFSLNFTLDIVLGYALYLLHPYQGGMGVRQTKMKVSRMASEIKLPREETGKVSQPDSYADHHQHRSSLIYVL